MKLKHIISSKQFEKSFIRSIFEKADQIKSGRYNKNILAGRIMATLFYEPSTRTRFSFESAMQRLGGSVISTENAYQFSSAAKGETIEDTIRIVSSYSDVIVLRHDTLGASQVAASLSKVPVINAGDGNGEHPTQALLDLYTIFSKFKTPDFTVIMIGDLLNGRTIHSLSYLLSLYPKIKIIFVSPKALAIPKTLKSHLIATKIDFTETEDFDFALKKADVIYQTRIQKERFKTKNDYKKYFGRFIIDESTLQKIKPRSIIMHPLPRINEIAPSVDSDPRALYFQQAANGVYIRMALLLYLLGPKNQ
ncbi:MAG: aspartate carbamoyltransferase [Candidatus Curtissbacteria bacterium]|nr:aspartate carbamoyltransferase [Candidatus Curtissbacteria bacterium]